MPKKPKSLVSGVVDGVVSTGIGSLIFTFLGLISFMLTSRWLVKEDLGVFIVLQLVVGFVVGISSLGLDLAITKFIAENEQEVERQKIINNVVTFRLITIAASCIIAVLLQGPLFELFGGTVYHAIIGYIPLLVLLESFNRLIDSVLGGYFRFKWIALLSGIMSALSLIFIILFVGWQGWGLAGRIWARMAALFLTMFSAIIFAHIKFRFELNFKILKKLITFSFPLFLNYILSFVFIRADTFIVGGFFGANEIAVYEIARKIPESIESMYEAFRKVYFPYVSDLFAKKRLDLGTMMLNHSLRLIAFAGVLSTLMAFFFGEEVIVLLFSVKYQESVPLFGLLMVLLTLSVIDSTLGYSLVALGEQSKPLFINSIRTGLNFAGYFLLIPLVGIFGVVFANIGGMLVANPLNVHFLKRRNVQASFPGFIKPLLIGMACYGFASIFLPDHWIFQLGVLILYIVVSFVFKVLTYDDLVMLIDQAKRLLKITWKPDITLK